MPAGLSAFSQATRDWFAGNFAAPTPAQEAAWEAISSRRNALVIAPTGSGKTLAAFLHSIDTLLTEPAPQRHTRVLYVSPLKALAVDIERNLTLPLEGIAHLLAARGLPSPGIRVAVRSGDTPAAQRRSLIAHPPDILITTPESLFLMLSSQAASTLAHVRTLIVDEVHALAGTKRGAHLALSLERLEALNITEGLQRIGLSATVRPPEAVAAFLGGDARPVDIIAPPTPKTWHLDIRVPVDDMSDLGSFSGSSARADPATVRPVTPGRSIWPDVEEAVLDEVLTHTSTICFVNSRMVAERLTAHLNERAAARSGTASSLVGTSMPANDVGTSGVAWGADGVSGPVVAQAHHGSISKARRAEIEADLKAGRLPCVVATSSLELGIDMGDVDLVIQIGAPPSVASGLQRVGRAGHHVGAVSQGIVFPMSRPDLLESAVIVTRMATGQIEAVRRINNPLDVLAQHLVSCCLDAEPTASDLFDLVRRADGFQALPRAAFDAVLDMLTGRYPSESFAELRPRLAWDRATDTLRARPGARRLVTTSGGTIPDRGLFAVVLAGRGEDPPPTGRNAPPRRVGELDEEMVHESRIGDVITLGSSGWRIEAITPHQVQVSPAPGLPGRLPFWHGDSPSRPAELGAAVGDFLAAIDDADAPAARTRLAGNGLDGHAADNLVAYVAAQRRAIGVLPNATTVVVERFRDDLGDWRVCIHCPLGLGVLRPWMLAVQRHLADRLGVDARVVVRNDGAILRLPMADAPPPVGEALAIDPDEIEDRVTRELYGSSLFAARFRECAARALLLPRREPGRRSPLWQQRLRAAQLLGVAADFPRFPIVLEALRECLDDDFDLPALRALLAGIASGKARLIEVETPRASPFAAALQFGYAGEFMYDADQPLAERRAAAAALDTELLARLLGHDTADALEPSIVADVGAELACRCATRQARSAEHLWDILRALGPLTRAEAHAVSTATPEETDAWLDDLLRTHRLIETEIGRTVMLAAEADTALLADLANPSTGTLNRLVARWMNHHVAVRPADIADRYGWSPALVAGVLDAMVARGEVRRGRFVDGEPGEYDVADAVLALVRRRTAAWLRSQVRPVPPERYADFLPAWHELGAADDGTDALARAADLLAGYAVPASMLETFVLPARVRCYAPAMLDDLIARGEIVWSGAGRIGDHDGWVRLWPAEWAASPPEEEALSEVGARILDRLRGGGAWRAVDLVDDGLSRKDVEDVLWELAWAGYVTCDTLAPLRAFTRAGGALRRPTPPRPSRRLALLARPPAAPVSPAAVGRWSALPPPSADVASVALGALVSRHGVLTRGALAGETGAPTFGTAYPVLAGLADAGLVRRGYFVAGLGGAQFALRGAVERLRDEHEHSGWWLLAACDPANAWGAALSWPPSDGHRPSRGPGGLVVLENGSPVLYVERGAHTVVTFGRPSATRLTTALNLIGTAIDEGRLDEITVRRINDGPALDARDLVSSLVAAGYRMVPQGFRRRPST
ncbi:MAG: DEAD/DEAH box helicase [Actinomycetia bacterium]|nr:DEAD/DEAH box helicase [Actinomycetes bacterium]